MSGVKLGASAGVFLAVFLGNAADFQVLGIAALALVFAILGWLIAYVNRIGNL
jgi:hypothetical protein